MGLERVNCQQVPPKNLKGRGSRHEEWHQICLKDGTRCAQCNEIQMRRQDTPQISCHEDFKHKQEAITWSICTESLLLSDWVPSSVAGSKVAFCASVRSPACVTLAPDFLSCPLILLISACGGGGVVPIPLSSSLNLFEPQINE